jgi:hypothetical protein
MHFHTNIKKICEYAIFPAVFAMFFFSGAEAFADTYSVRGWGWAGNGDGSPGWISFSNISETAAGETPLGVYGVFYDNATEALSGYAWSSNIGWINFNAAALSGCPSGACPPKINWGTGKASGWARACAVFLSGCSGGLRSDVGGWTGWISLAKTALDPAPYGLEIDTALLEFKTCGTCYAWGGGDEGFGWMQMANGVKLVPSMTLDFKINGDFNPEVALGDSITISWTPGPSSATFNYCTATNGSPAPEQPWAGAKTFLTIPPYNSEGNGVPSYNQTQTGQHIYNLICGNNATGDVSPSAQVILTVIAGTCGPADTNNVALVSPPSGTSLCTVGSASAVTKDTAPDPDQWKWTCGGTPCSADVKKAGGGYEEF